MVRKQIFLFIVPLVFSVIFESVWLDPIILVSASQNRNRTELNVFFFNFLIGFFSRFDIFGFLGLISFLFFSHPCIIVHTTCRPDMHFQTFFFSFSSCIFFPLHTYTDLSFKEFSILQGLTFFLQKPVKPINPTMKN